MINAIEDVSTGTTLGFMRDQQIDCEFKDTSTDNMGKHVNLEHNVEELFICKLCDFDSKHGRELKNYNDENVLCTAAGILVWGEL